ncbi:MAG: SDR family NAD(P)-dependent oxidoreductase, partial [Defluviitaleaceae bacterium]|nr:SDR family NAD(P)-dependent oxidoreductase [Defluviitaleaceae bacterium]
MNIFDLTGKSIIITAGASYLGGAMADAVAGFGAKVAVTSRDLAKAQSAADAVAKAYGTETLGLAMDLDNAESIKQMFR